LEIAVPPISESKYCSAEDSVCLEDHTGRIQLTGQPLLPTADSLLVTGMPVAVLGRESEQGAFEVLDFCLSGMAPPFPLPQPVDSGDRFILLLSGLELNERSDTFQLQLLADLINGMLTVDASQIVRVILAGNSLAVEAVDCTINDDIQMPVDPLLLLDNFVEQLAASVPVDLMPGLTDPAGYVWPQQPIHKALLPHSGRLTNLTSQTNPCQFSVDGIEYDYYFCLFPRSSYYAYGL
jgi:DNA polymerase delta subunit 2